VPKVLPRADQTITVSDAMKKQPPKKEFVAKPTSKPGAVKRAYAEDTKNDKRVAKKHGVKFTGY